MLDQTISFAGRLRSRRLELGLTLAEVAERAELSLPYISNLECGRGNPTIGALTELAEALEIPLPMLLGTEDADPLELMLAKAPPELLAFSRTKRFTETVERFAKTKGVSVDAMRTNLLVAMTAAPRRSTGRPTEDDWRRLLDVFVLILSD